MQHYLIWEKLNGLLDNLEEQLPYEEVESQIINNPDKITTFFDALFIKVSFQRMKQLAQEKGYGELSQSYFTIDNMNSTWRLIRSELNCPFHEYTRAIEYMGISKKKFQRSLTNAEARIAYECLMYISRTWLSNTKVFENSSVSLPFKEEVKTVVGEVNQMSSPDKIAARHSIEKDIGIIKEMEEPITVEFKEPSEFIKMLSVLPSSSKESVVNADTFGYLRDYMHVERNIQIELEKLLRKVKEEEKPKLILLCGSVGDGKSHLLAFMKEKRPELLEGIMVHNDSTESFDPNQNSLEALEKVLADFDGTENINKTVIIAINLGVLHNFYHRQREAGRFKELCDFIDSSGIFERSEHRLNDNDNFKLLNFAETQPYSLTSKGAESSFFLELFDKITIKSENNPFHVAWLKDKGDQISSAAHINYELLQQPAIKESIIQSLIEAMIKQKVFISTRTFYNFLYEIVVPVNNKIQISKITLNVEDMLPNLMYGHPDRSPLLAALNAVDPLKKRMESTDRLISNFILSSNHSSFILENIGEETFVGAWEYVDQMVEKGQQIQYSQLLIRHHSLLYKRDYDDTFMEYINYLYSFYIGDESEIGNLFELLERVIYAWKGSPRNKFIFMDSANKNFRMAVEITIDPEVDKQFFGIASGKKEVDRFSPSIKIGYTQRGESYLFELDFELYLLLKKVSGGYRPNRQDMQDALQFSEFHEKIIKSADKTKHVLLVHKLDGNILEVKKPKFSKAKFEVEKVN